MFYRILFALLVVSHLTFAGNGEEDRILLKGHVYAKLDGSPLAYVNIYPFKSNYGTFTNLDGAFELLVHKEDLGSKLVVSIVGYKAQILTIDTSVDYKIYLVESEGADEDIIAMDMTAVDIIEKFRDNVKSNYPHNPMVNRIFLREYERLRSEENLYLNEVVVDYLRYGYFDGNPDLMKLVKGRNKIYDDSTGFSYTSGGFNDIQSDMIKYPRDFLISSKGYTYELDHVSIGERNRIFRIKFTPKSKKEYQGYLYIEDQTFALIKAEVEHSEIGREIVNIMSKKSGFYWDSLSETVVYKPSTNGKYNLSEIITEGMGYDHHLKKQMIATSEIMVIETDVATFFANEFYDIEMGVSLFELDFEASDFFWDDNNYMVMENSFKIGYNED